MPADPPLRVGLVGAGWAGQEHCASLAGIDDARLVAVVDPDAPAAAALAARHDASVLPSVEAMLGDDLVDALVVATPSGVHRESVVPALDHGLAVSWKSRSPGPWRTRSPSPRRPAAYAPVCAVGYQWRAAEAATDLAGRLEDQRIAMLLSQGVGIMQARPLVGRHSRLSGGLVYERASHHIDLQRMVAGEVRAVRATRGDVPLAGAGGNGGGTEDVIAVELRFDSGAIGTVLLGWVGEDYPPVKSRGVVATDTVYDLALDPDFVLHDRRLGPPGPRTGEPPFVAQMRRFSSAPRSPATRAPSRAMRPPPRAPWWWRRPSSGRCPDGRRGRATNHRSPDN